MSYSIILNSNNRANPTGSSNDATYNFDWNALPEGEYKVIWKIYRIPFAIQLTAFQTLLATKAPWARYSASSWSGTTLTDLTGNARHATTSGVSLGTTTGNGATGTITSIGGGTANTILWPAGSIPATFTIASLTRYATTGTRGRVLNGSSTNFLCGHFSSSRGVAFNEGFRQGTNTGTLTNWVGMVFTNGTGVAVPNNVRVDGVALATTNGGVGGNGALPDLRINGAGINAESSDFEFSQLLIWDQALTATEITTVSTAINTYLTTGILQ